MTRTIPIIFAIVLSNRWTKLMRFPEKKLGNYWEPEYSVIYQNIPKLENWLYSKKPINDKCVPQKCVPFLGIFEYI